MKRILSLLLLISCLMYAGIVYAEEPTKPRLRLISAQAAVTLCRPGSP